MKLPALFIIIAIIPMIFYHILSGNMDKQIDKLRGSIK